MAGPPFVFMVVFFVLPAAIMVLASFRFPGEHGGLAAEGFTLEPYQFLFSDVIYIEIFVKSFWIGRVEWRARARCFIWRSSRPNSAR